jgi:hypothetical protein
VALAVDAQQLLARRLGRLDDLEPEPVARIERRLDRPQPAGVLGMSAGVVLERARVAEVDAAHGPGTVAPL